MRGKGAIAMGNRTTVSTVVFRRATLLKGLQYDRDVLDRAEAAVLMKPAHCGASDPT